MFEKLTYYMDNGFKVVMHRENTEKVVTVGVMINYGSMYENEDNNGIAHFIEHILSSDNHDGSIISQKMEEMRLSGATYSAQTDKERTIFYIDGMSDNLKLYLELLSNLVFAHREFSDQVFDNEKKVVERELVSYYSSFNQINGRAIQALYSDAGVGRIIVGKKDNVRNFTKDNVLEMLDKVYVPENASIVVCGDFNYDEAKGIINDCFGQIKDTGVSKEIESVKLTPGYFFNNNFDGESAVLSLCYRKISNENKKKISDSCELFLKAMLDPILFQRMGYQLRIKDGLSYNMGGFGYYTGQFLSLGVTAIFNSKKLFDVYDVMKNSLDEIRDSGFREEELEKAKRNCITNRLYKHCNHRELAVELIKKANDIELYSPDNDIREISNLKLDDVNGVLSDLLKDDNLGFACIGNCEFESLIERYVV
ncbi:MAG: insulinase family protein [Pseudobutyrivibrio sp.]|uniref:M16 family metallopeptidase n=1 Tax=Pseudobutyrivibrio sp. TaxID=2014367 RepID=UPI0025D2E8AA|nr:pitrilysin family protein [Pseudobutyrivibrio sp.]MBQ8489572.1 insulinase family protein [Pseudobutyrivibrio sp.]